MIEYFNFGLTVLAAVCLGATLYYLLKYKSKEDERLFKGFNAFIVSLGFLELYLLTKVFVLFNVMFGWLSNVVYNVNLILDVGVTPLIVICMLIGVMLFREV